MARSLDEPTGPGGPQESRGIASRGTGQSAPCSYSWHPPYRTRLSRVGADGEEEVGRRLRKLGPGWHVIHVVPVGTKECDIDHVVIGPPGVFTLNTKNHTGKRVWVHRRSFKVSGQSTQYLRNSRYEAQRSSKLLTVACGFAVGVHPLIVVIAAELTIKAQPPGVTVVGRKRITKWLSDRPPVLAADQVEGIYEIAPFALRRGGPWWLSKANLTEGCAAKHRRCPFAVGQPPSSRADLRRLYRKRHPHSRGRPAQGGLVRTAGLRHR